MRVYFKNKYNNITITSLSQAQVRYKNRFNESLRRKKIHLKYKSKNLIFIDNN